MKHEAISLEEREADLAQAHDELEHEAESWLEARVNGVRSQERDESLESAIHVVRQADRRLQKTRKRLTE